MTTERAAGLAAIDDLRVPGAVPPERRPEPGDPPRVLELLERERITICLAVPVVWETLLTLPQLDTADLSALRACIGAGATTPVEVIRAWQARGVGMRQGYGQTEFAGGYAASLTEWPECLSSRTR